MQRSAGVRWTWAPPGNGACWPRWRSTPGRWCRWDRLLRRALVAGDGPAIVHRSRGYALTTDMTEPLTDLRRIREL
ncbi:hypothetical protein [Saccharothrix sp. NRRL B-16314]|uniref:hypothetical protein n=1 Tax=Saccharothrix sp. NRRL B-16314 TaxID=1463825 RepID=UPI000B1BC49F|nr:hypothetical protein [Saccharothrix sp. NRRL B-16314]